MAETTNLYIPDPVNTYQGAQVIINSNRLTFNAKEDSILQYSNKDIGFSAQGSIYFDTSTNDKGLNSSKFIVNSPEMYFGLQKGGLDDGKLPVERAVLGNQLRTFLNKILLLMEDIIDDLEDHSFTSISSEPGKPTIGNYEANKLMGELRKRQIQILRANLSIDEFDQLGNADLCTFLSKRIKLT